MRYRELPEQVRRLLFEVGEITREGPAPDFGAIGAQLAKVAEWTDFSPYIATMPTEQTSAIWLHQPDRGPRLALVHRPAGAMAHIHTHHTWVALAPIAGAETHQWWTASRRHGRAAMTMAGYATLRPGDHVTVIPPGDTHSHGHLAGTGDAPYTLVLLGDNMTHFPRFEYDTTGTYRRLPPGDPGQPDRPLTSGGY